MEQKNKKFTRTKLFYSGPSKWDVLLFGLLAAFCWLAFAHPDIQETARHGYILIRSTLDGNFFQFFEDTLNRTYGYGYVNAAHYNILMYILYALWELPLYLIERIGGFAFSDVALSMWCKAIGAGFYLGCGILCGRLAQQVSCSEEASAWAPLLFWLNPISFFSTIVMGQYDSIALFFLLWALTAYFEKKYLRFSIIVGVGMVFKFFPLFVFVPLILLVEKRFLHIVKYLIVSMWLYIPTTLLFAGRTGDAAFFNQLMTDRLFATTFAGGAMDYSAFGLAMVLICAAAFFIRPADTAQWHRWSLYLGLAAFTALFTFVLWHPQWLILLVPFVLLTTLQQSRPTGFVYIELALYIGFFVMMAMLYPRALEGNLFDMGVFQPLVGVSFGASNAVQHNAFYFNLIPYLNRIVPILFYGGLLSGLLLKLPVGTSTLAEKLGGAGTETISWRFWAWGVFAIAFGGFWVCPSVFSYLKVTGIL